MNPLLVPDPTSVDPLGSFLARATFEAAAEGLLILDAGGDVVAANAAFCALYELEPWNVVGLHHSSLARDREVRRLGNEVDQEGWVSTRALKGERISGVLQHVRDRQTGSEFFARYGATPLWESGRLAAVIISVEDVTDATLAHQRVDAALSAAEVGTWRIDLTDEKVWADRNFARIYGLPEQSLQGGSRSLVYDAVHPDDRERVANAAQAAAEAGLSHELEYRIIRPDGTMRWILSRGQPELSESGVTVRRIGSIVDITARKLAQQDLKVLNDDLERRVAERTEELTRANRDLNEFSYSVAHDLRAPLRSIVSTSRILMDDLGDRLTYEERQHLDRQVKNAIRLAGIVDDLLNFARLAQTPLRKESLDVTHIARSAAVEVAGRDWPSKPSIDVQNDLAAEGDAHLLGYALVNLLDNACKFSPEGAVVHVGYENGVYFVRDQGVGFDMEHAPKLFVAFERLVDQESFTGTGVGLANVKRIVERHGGQIWAESTLGQGATFWFTLT